jgi:signal transduction histidine kinase
LEASGKRLLILLNDLLDVARMDAGRTEYRREPGDLRDVVHHTLMELDPLIKGKNMQVCLRIGDHTKAVFDKQHMIQVLVNLVSNAVKFSDSGSLIAIEISETCQGGVTREIQCRVIDQGPGVPEAELRTIFDKFIQSSKTKTGAGGTGLGLAICNNIIKAHGGKIWAENGEPRGAIFCFVIQKGEGLYLEAASA